MRAIGAAAFLLVAAAVAASTALLRSDPANNLARVRLVVASTARTTDVTISGATLAGATAAIVDAPPGSGTSQTGQTIRLSNRRQGQRAEARFDLILAGVVPGGTVNWGVELNVDADTTIDVLTLNDPAAPRSVDRFTGHAASEQFGTATALMASSGAVTLGAASPHVVLAGYYPWYASDTWRDPQFADQPTSPYSSDDQAYVDSQAAQARSAGIDAFIVSWQGPSADWNNRRMHVVLDAARRAGMRACVYVESFVANPANDTSQPTDAGTMAQWIVDAVDRFGGDPAYLRVGDRPVIFVYATSRLTAADWIGLLARVRATGRNPIVFGDFIRSGLLSVFDGEYQYINVTQSSDELQVFYRSEGLRVRTFDLINAVARRIWAASVCPGYDDSRIANRASHVVVDRAGGTVYDDEWRTAISTGADWVVVTTWNEFYENTHIEPSARYGSTYLTATKKWTAELKGLPGPKR